MVEYASFEELFLLRPVELVDAEQNQLVRVASDEDRLRVLRDVFGGTSNVTALQPIIVVEGVGESDSRKVVPDRKLYRALHPGFDRVTLLAGGGKGECKALVRTLNELLPILSPRLRATALLDRDLGPADPTAQVQLLPVAMIENFLLDPDSMWEAIQSVVERTDLATVDDIGLGLDAILDSLKEEEADRRTIAQLGVAYFRPSRPTGGISGEAKAFADEVVSGYSESRVESLRGDALAQVRQLRELRRRREEFHGKTALDAFYKRYMHASGLPRVVFAFETARHARRRGAVVSFFNTLFENLAAPA